MADNSFFILLMMALSSATDFWALTLTTFLMVLARWANRKVVMVSSILN